VLVAVCYGDHQHHDASIEVFLEHSKVDGACAAHSLAEVCASVTRMPGRHRMSGAQAMLFLGTVRERLTIIALDEVEYFSGIARYAAMGVVAGTIYDGLLALCALKAAAETIYTSNIRHFQRCGPEVAGRLRTP
jgi:predicted nucleic acid-binding protein